MSPPQHVETNLKATIAGISVVFAFHDENRGIHVIRTMLNILQTNASVVTSLGTYFLSQITLIFFGHA